MFRRVRSLITICVLVGLIVFVSHAARANWEETFNANTFDLATWEFHCYPDLTKTFTASIQDGPDDNDYLALAETTSIGDMPLGSGFGGGFGLDEPFTDVRIGAVVNVVGDASRNLHVFGGRAQWVYDPTGTISGNPYGLPGVIASGYVLLINWEDGPANLILEVQKVIYFGNIMEIDSEVIVPGLDHVRSYYAELDIVGSDPTYITGSLYEYKGGPLVARVPTLIDTNAQDPWEEPGLPDQVYPPFASGPSFIGGFNEHPEPAGYYTTFDDVFSISDGPVAVNPSPSDSVVDVPVDTTLSWVEAQFATGRELWIGKPGAMEKVDPNPSGTTYTPGNLELGETYEWRIDQIGPSGTVTGHTWTFTVANYVVVDDFESYTTDEDIRSAWVDNIDEPGLEYVFLASAANSSMEFRFQNQHDPFFTEITRTFVDSQDWTANGVEELSFSFVGERANVEHLMYLTLEDAAGQSFRVENPFTHAVQTNYWRHWTIALGLFSDNGVDLTSIKKITIGTGDGTQSGQGAEDDEDHIWIDQIILRPAG